MKKPVNVLTHSDVPESRQTGYPQPFAGDVAGRINRFLGEACGLTQFGVTLTRLEPGAWSSQRHWHENEDEFVYVLEGSPSLVTDEGERVLAPGQFCAFPAGQANGHHLVNRTDRPALFLAIGTCADRETVHYSDIDMVYRQEAPGSQGYYRRDGSRY
ncbi:MAG: cupin domain-containing protein [Alphaproteobacteria bacterium]|nr:cupin domain-containing protein [Alphaproteobacteria bacterium]